MFKYPSSILSVRPNTRAVYEIFSTVTHSTSSSIGTEYL